jgi:hypothetical protein
MDGGAAGVRRAARAPALEGMRTGTIWEIEHFRYAILET